MPVPSDNDYLRKLLNAIPVPVLIMDEDLKVQDLNTAASVLAGISPEMILRRFCGEVLHCLHERESEKRCGETESCSRCIIRKSVLDAVAGKSTVRQLEKMRLEKSGKTRTIHLLVTAAPFDDRGRTLAVVMLEDVTELTDLRKILPICSRCKKIRSDESCWEDVDRYLSRYGGLTFSHSVCPDCMNELYPKHSGE